MLNSLRTAIYNACRTLDIPVYDYWVVGAAYPYIITSSVYVEDEFYKLNSAEDYTFEVHIFDKNVGKVTVANYTASLRESLANLDGFGVRISTTILDDKEPNVVHAILSVRLKKYV